MEFHCNKHKKIKVTHNTYSTVITSSGETVYKDEDKNHITCPKCGANMTHDIEEGDYSVNYGRFTSMSEEDKKASLKKRSKNHNKGFYEHRRVMDRDHLNK